MQNRQNQPSIANMLNLMIKLVEAGGVEPPSGNLPLRRLHT